MYEEYGKFYVKYNEKYGNGGGTSIAVFMMVGAFYELYDIRDKLTGRTLYNVKNITDILGIQLVVKKEDVGKDKEALFAGFPDYTLHKHGARLTAAGWTVVIVDQVKIGTKVTSREVVRILSPSTHIEALETTSTPYLTSVYMTPSSYGIATLDMSTGMTITYQGIQHDDLAQHLSIFIPKEILVNSTAAVTTTADETQFRRTFCIPPTTNLYVRPATTSLGTFANQEANAAYLSKSYSVQSMLPVREYLCIAEQRNAELALLFLLQFAEEHLPSAIKLLQRNTPWAPEQSVVCGGGALRQLQMEEVVNLFSECLTPMGKRDIRMRLLRPLTFSSTIRQRLAEVTEISGWHLSQRTTLERHLRYMSDLPRQHRRILLATATNTDFVSLGQSYSAIADILKDCFTADAESFKPPPECQTLLATYRDLFHTHISMTKALKASDDCTPFNTDTYAEIGVLEARIQECLNEFEAVRSGLCSKASLATDAIRLEGREKEPFGLRASTTTLKALRTLQLPGITIQALSSGGWIETPTLVTLNGQLLSLRQRLSQQYKGTLLKVCQAISDTNAWTTLEEWISHVDCTQAIAKTSWERGFTCPILEDSEADSHVDIEFLRHPLVEATGTRVAYVQHNVQIGSIESGADGWLVYGMNASGKSTLMKSVGIAILLAQAGSYVPAKKMTLSPFRAVYTRILNQDNLFAGLSSFAVEMTELRQILRAASPTTLVLGDEMCAGTESVSAMSLVAAGIQWLSEKKAKYIFATHLHDLPKLLNPTSQRLKIWHLKVEYDPVSHKLIYHRNLMPGSGSSLYGLEVARAMDLPMAFIELAQANRRKLLGATTQQEAAPSSWNSAIIRRTCEVCGSETSRDLEVHHIQQRASASSLGILPNGVPMNASSNLVVLCSVCHDKHHGGELEVESLVQTSSGTERASVVSEKPKKGKKEWTEEELGIIQRILREYKTASLKALVYQLKSEHDITISVQGLSAIKRGLAA